MISFSGTGRRTTSIDAPLTGRHVVPGLGRVLHNARIFVNIDYKRFDASSWPVMESGPAGPVRLLVHD